MGLRNRARSLYVARRPYKFTRKLVESRLGGEVYAIREMLAHVALLRRLSSPFGDTLPGAAALEACESPPTYRKTKGAVADRRLARVFLGLQQRLESGELDNVCWLRGHGNRRAGLLR